MRALLPTLICLGLSACGPATGPATDPAFFTTDSLNGHTFSGQAATLVATGNSDDQGYLSFLSIEFPAEGEAVFSFDGFTGPTLFWDADEEAYLDPDGAYALIFSSDATTPDIVTFAVLGNLDTATPFTQLHVNGNLTDPQNVPTSGFGIYSGEIGAFDGAGNVMEGEIDIEVNFNVAFASGGFYLDGTQAGRADFTLNPVALSNGQFETYLTSDEMPIYDSSISGALFGENADQFGGEFYVNADNGSFVGSYTASQ